ncbi:MAG: hypothetical protein NT069_17520 [Planctomycetota bacterium]|nr:hypothetical protein [Planctomycetota bacterium]
MNAICRPTTWFTRFLGPVAVALCALAVSAAPPERRDQKSESGTDTGRLVSTVVGVPNRNTFVIDYDGSFLFLGRHHGSTRDADGPTEPGLFVHSKKHRRWIEISEVPTRGAKFGKSQSADPAEQERLSKLSVGWDFTSLAQRPTVSLPLRTGGSIVLPDRVDFDEKSNRYLLRFNSELKIESAETVLSLDRAELERAFESGERE